MSERMSEAKRRIALLTDDPDEAYAELKKRRATRDGQGWDIWSKFRNLPDPPKTASRYVVFKPDGSEPTDG